MSDPQLTDIEVVNAPYRREIVLQDVKHESGLTLLRIRIREGRRFTILDIDGPTARKLADLMGAWSDRAGEAGIIPDGDEAAAPSGDST